MPSAFTRYANTDKTLYQTDLNCQPLIACNDPNKPSSDNMF